MSIGVADLEVACDFYTRVLATIGLEKLVAGADTVGFGKHYPEFWLNLRDGRNLNAETGMHVCLRARSVDVVRAFYAAAVGAGASADGEPGLRPQYSESYYAAFIRDQDGNRIEVVTFVNELLT